MNPVMVHADGTDCHHEGQAQATIQAAGGPLCPAGHQITHVRFNSKTLTIEEACAGLQLITEAFARIFTPMSVAFAEFGRRFSADPVMRAFAAAAAVVDEEPERLEGSPA